MNSQVVEVGDELLPIKDARPCSLVQKSAAIFVVVVVVRFLSELGSDLEIINQPSETFRGNLPKG